MNLENILTTKQTQKAAFMMQDCTCKKCAGCHRVGTWVSKAERLSVGSWHGLLSETLSQKGRQESYKQTNKQAISY